jgi:hypothetical protein
VDPVFQNSVSERTTERTNQRKKGGEQIRRQTVDRERKKAKKEKEKERKRRKKMKERT